MSDTPEIHVLPGDTPYAIEGISYNVTKTRGSIPEPVRVADGTPKVQIINSNVENHGTYAGSWRSAVQQAWPDLEWKSLRSQLRYFPNTILLAASFRLALFSTMQGLLPPSSSDDLAMLVLEYSSTRRPAAY